MIGPWTLAGILAHPLNRGRKLAAARDYLRWQLGARLLPGPVVIDWVEGVRLIVRRGETGLTGNVYCGLHDLGEMAFVLHALRAGDLFVDVGANAGAYTLLACAARRARGWAFEAVPETWARLRDNLRLNGIESSVRFPNIGIADRPGELKFTRDLGPMNRVLLPGGEGRHGVGVAVKPLDEALGGEAPTLVKIDVEGFEWAVLAGARATLAQTPLLALIVELNGSGARYGHDDADVVRALAQYRFAPCRYDPFLRELAPLEGADRRSGNTLFVRDREAVLARVRGAAPFVVKGTSL